MKIYAFIVCVISIIVFLVFLPMAAYGVISIISPELTIDTYTYQEFLSGEISDERYNILLLVSAKSALQSLLTQGFVIIITIILWATHWRIAAKKN